MAILSGRAIGVLARRAVHAQDDDIREDDVIAALAAEHDLDTDKVRAAIRGEVFRARLLRIHRGGVVWLHRPAHHREAA